MIDWLRSVRFTWWHIAMIAASSALATAVIVESNTGGQRLPDSALVALRQRVAVHRAPVRAPVSSTPAAAASPSVPASAPAISPVDTSVAQAPATASTPASAAASPSTSTSTSTSTGTDTSSTTTPAPSKTPTAGHVFVIALTTTSYRAAFGAGSVAQYLNRTLRRRGVLLSGYRTLGGSQLPDYLASISGQAPNADTRDDCRNYAEFPSAAKPGASGQVPGAGCVYPNTVLTIADQVTAAGKQWKAYLAGMGGSSCVHPDSGAAGDGQLPGAGADYATWHNPFVYFHSLLDLGGCSNGDVGLQHLGHDLRSERRTPTYSFIAPGRCDEPGASACPGGTSSGLAAEDAFLKRWVPAITASPAYKRGGVLIIVFAKAPAARSGAARTGALIVSPRAKAGSTASAPYTPYSVLRSAEDLLGYTPLVHARSAKSFASIAMPGA